MPPPPRQIVGLFFGPRMRARAKVLCPIGSCHVCHIGCYWVPYCATLDPVAGTGTSSLPGTYEETEVFRSESCLVVSCSVSVGVPVNSCVVYVTVGHTRSYKVPLVLHGVSLFGLCSVVFDPVRFSPRIVCANT